MKPRFFPLLLLALAFEQLPAADVRNTWPVSTSIKYLAGPSVRLKKGEAIAVFDSAPLILEISRLRVLVDQLREEEANLQRQLEKAQLDLKQGNPTQRAKVEEAQATLDRYMTSESLLSALSLQQSVNEANSAHANQLVRFNARDKMLQEGFIQKAEYEMEEFRLKSAKLAMDMAAARLDKFQKVDKPKALADLQSKLEIEVAELKAADARNKLLAQQLPVRLESLHKRIEAVQGVLSRNQQHLAETAIAAPAEGVFNLRPTETAPPLQVGALVGPEELVGTFTPRP